MQRNRVERDDDWHQSDDSYSPRRHWRFKSPTRIVGPRFAYGRVMTLVSCDDDLDWEFALIRTMGTRPVLEEPMAKRSKKGCEELPILHPDAAGIDVGVSELFVAVSADLDPQGAVGRYRPIH